VAELKNVSRRFGVVSSVRRFSALVALALVLVVPTIGTLPIHSVGAVTGVSVTINCTSNPETIKVTNKTSKAFTVTSVGSLYQPRAGEPYAVSVKINAGSSATFKAGPAATGTRVLTHQYIFSNTAGHAEGAKVVTTVGNTTRHCPA
jgi:hypothetical protein